MKKWITALVLALSLAVAGSARAETKIATVDFNRAMNEVDEGKAALESLEAAMSPRRKELEEKQAALEKMAQDLRKQSVVLAADAKAKKEAEYQEQAMAFQQMSMRYQQDLERMFNQVNEDLRLKLEGVLEQVAKKKGYTLVIEKSLIMYQADGMDLTDELVKAYNSATTGAANGQ